MKVSGLWALFFLNASETKLGRCDMRLHDCSWSNELDHSAIATSKHPHIQVHYSNDIRLIFVEQKRTAKI